LESENLPISEQLSFSSVGRECQTCQVGVSAIKNFLIKFKQQRGLEGLVPRLDLPETH
jgi:hypothetical protein